jgi:hypothetical protein
MSGGSISASPTPNGRGSTRCSERRGNGESLENWGQFLARLIATGLAVEERAAR